jgi:signal transduction histidine kinase
MLSEDATGEQQPEPRTHPHVATVVAACTVVGTGLIGAVLASGGSTPTMVRGAGVVVVALALVGLAAILGLRRQARVRERELLAREQALVLERSSLVQLISHELRTPLTVIRGGVETLRGSASPLAPDQQRLLDATWRSTVRLESMVHVVLRAAESIDGTVAGLPVSDGPGGAVSVASMADEVLRAGWSPGSDDDEVAVVDVELGPLIKRAAESIRADLPARLRWDLPSDAHLLTIEPYLWVAVRCLLDNAAKFSPPDAPIEVSCSRDGERITLRLTDHGPGVPDGYERLAFEPFTQADVSLQRSHTGIGMGLYTARRLARRLGGDVDLRSPADGGVIATIVLPDLDRRPSDQAPTATETTTLSP